MKARRLSILALTALLTFGGSASAQQGQMITPNYKDADLGQVIEAVSQITGKNFIIDPRVRAQVTMLSSTPMSAAAFYQAFLSILQVHGFVAIPAGKVIKIVPDANARQMPSDDLPDKVSSTSDEIVTQVVKVQNISAAQLVPILRPLIPQYGHLAAYPAANMLIISDRAANVNRMMRIIQRLDQGGNTDIDVIRLEHASADEVVRVVNALTGVQGAEAANVVKIVADNRTNSVLLSGDANERLRIRALITHLDTPLETGGDTRVRYLRYADAEKLAAKLKEQAQGLVAAQAGGAPAGTAPAASAGANDRDVTIWADPETNALVITAPAKIMSSLMRVVDQLDIRRKQVLIEAMLVEVSADASRDLGVNWVIDGSQSNFLVGLFNQPIGGVSLGDVAAGIQNPSSVTSAPNGLTVGIGRKEPTGTNFAAILRALQADGDTNVVSMPSVITLDNEEAKIEVAQEVPFITGSYATTTGGATNAVNPFQTIQRKEVGNILKITPQITDEGTILLKIEQESSGIAAAAEQVALGQGLITNKRTISTRVLVDNGGMLVLGGLIEDRLTESQNKVPLLGSIPLLGELFRTRSTQKTKTNLMVFIRPRIINGPEDAAIETNAKYQFMRNLQMHRRNGKVQLMPGAQQPTLPELEGPTTPAKPVPDMNTSGAGDAPAGTPPAPQAPPTPETPPATPPKGN